MSSSFDSVSVHQFSNINFTEIINDFHDLLIDFKNKNTKKPSFNKEAINRCEALSLKYKLASEQFKSNYRELATYFAEISIEITSYKNKLHSMDSMQSLKKSWNELAGYYEKVLLEIKQKRLPNVNIKNLKHLTPINYPRNIFHATNAVISVVLYHYFLTYNQAVWILGSVFILFTAIEIIRRVFPQTNDFFVNQLFGMISRPQERTKINGASYYALAALLMTLTMPKSPLLLGLIVLGFGDPFANIIGIKFGKTKIFKQKSLEGALAFITISFVLTFLFSFFVLSLPMSISNIAFLCLSTSIVGALIELFSFKLDDNFTILVGATLVASLWF